MAKSVRYCPNRSMANLRSMISGGAAVLTQGNASQLVQSLDPNSHSVGRRAQCVSVPECSLLARGWRSGVQGDCVSTNNFGGNRAAYGDDSASYPASFKYTFSGVQMDIMNVHLGVPGQITERFVFVDNFSYMKYR